MAKSPAYQMYASDWLGSRSVRFMDDYQRGWYIQLLNEAWDSDPQCMLPDDDEILQRLAGVSSHSRSVHDFNDRWLAVRRMFKRHGEYVANDRQMEEFAKQELRRKQASDAGRSSAAKRAAEANAIIAQHIDRSTTVERPLNDRCDFVQRNSNTPIPTPSPVPSPVSNSLSRRTGKPALDTYSPEFEELWQAFPAFRRKGKGAAWTAYRKANPSSDLHSRMVDSLKAQVSAFAATGKSWEFFPLATTWLNQRRWDDESAMPPIAVVAGQTMIPPRPTAGPGSQPIMPPKEIDEDDLPTMGLRAVLEQVRRGHGKATASPGSTIAESW